MESKTLEEALQSYSDYIYRFAFYLLPMRDDAQELVQRTWIKAWQHRDQLHEEAAFKGWLRTICLNEYRMMVRSNRVVESMDELEAEGIQFENITIDPIQEIVVEDAVRNMRNGCFLGMARKLTESQRIAFSLVDMFGLSIEDTALLMDISISAVKGLLFRARNNLESFFADHCMFMKEENACRCQAWIDFARNRDMQQHKIKTAFSALEFKEKGFFEQREIRNKLLYYYQHIPIAVPDIAWYDTLSILLKLS